MDFSQEIETVRQQVLGSLENQIYQQAVGQNLADTALKAIIAGAVSQIEIHLPQTNAGAAGGVEGALMGFLQPLAKQLPGIVQEAEKMGIGGQIGNLISQYHVDTDMRDAAIRGLQRYLNDNGGHLMQVAVDALVAKMGTL